MQSEIQYIKPNQEVYMVRNRGAITKVRHISLWSLVPILALLILGVYLLFASIGTEENGQTGYRIDGSVDYQVYLKDNDYYAEKYLVSGKQYIASLIDTIRVDFDYQMDADSAMNAHYEYEILSILKATDRNDKSKVLYEQTEVLKTMPVTQIENGRLAINDNVNVDYTKYNAIMRSFRSDFGIAANCFMDLRLIVKVDGAIKTEDTLAINIPLTDQTVDIAMDVKAINREEKVGTLLKEVYVKNVPLLVVGVILIVASMTAGIVIICLYATRYGDNWYAEALDKILKRYDTNIVSVDGIFYEPENTERVQDFVELLDAANGEGVMIQFCEVEPDYKAYFVVKGANTTYRYTLSRAYQDELRCTGQKKESF